jgi:hypothetical protein
MNLVFVSIVIPMSQFSLDIGKTEERDISNFSENLRT